MFKEVMKHAMKEILKGNFSIDLPVKLNGQYSSLELYSLLYGFESNFYDQVLSTKDPLEQLKHWLGSTLSSLNLGMEIMEPIHSCTGETYSAQINGIPLYMEMLKKDP